MILQTLIAACITILSIGLIFICISGYKRYRNSKLIFVCLVIVLFLIKGLIFSFDVFFQNIIPIEFDPTIGVIDIIMLVLLFMATFKRRINE